MSNLVSRYSNKKLSYCQQVALSIIQPSFRSNTTVEIIAQVRRSTVVGLIGFVYFVYAIF